MQEFRHEQDVKLSATVAELKRDLADALRLPLDTLSLKFGDEVLSETQVVGDLDLQGEEGTPEKFELMVEYTESQLQKVKKKQLAQSIDVEMDQGPGNPVKLVQVSIDNTSMMEKQFLGGYRHKLSGVEYHHAWSQTLKESKYTEADRKYCRETQTYDLNTRAMQTQREQSTQMARPDLLLDDSTDRELTSGPYMTSDEFFELEEVKTLVIQRHTRGWFGRKIARKLRKKKLEREEYLRREEARKYAEAEEARKREIERRMRPRKAEDFEILYNELEAWRLQESQKVKAGELDKQEEHFALQQLLHKETKLLQTIDRLKIAANEENRTKRIDQTLKAMSVPKRWELSDGRTVEVHTPFTRRAKELMQLYKGLNLPLLTTDERLDVLLHVKWTVKEFDCNLTRELVELIDREADLLNRGRSPKTLNGLRRRISNLFLAFLETPEFNPEAARFQVVPGDFDKSASELVEEGHSVY